MARLLGNPTGRCTAAAVLFLGLLAGFGCSDEPTDAATDSDAAIERAVAHPARPQGDRQRDAGRKPAEVMAFFQIEPGMRVADVMAGTGYYTEIVARIVGDDGKVYWHNNNNKYKDLADAALQRRLDVAPLDNVERSDSKLDELKFPGEPLDAVLLFLFYHDTYLMPTNRDAMNKAILDALKPGGLYCIIDHHAVPASADAYTAALHRIDAELVKAEVVFAGFEFEAESDVLRVPDDDRKTLAYGRGIRGKTDRFVYRFRKPN